MIGQVNQNVFIEKVAEKLKKDINKPDWASFAKTGSFKERPPTDSDWWYLRAASILRRIYLKGPIGVSKLSTLYGGKKNRGYKPERFYPGSTNIIRTILQDLEKAGLIKQGQKGVHKGRIVTQQGISLLNKTEQEILKILKSSKKETPKKEDKKEVKKDNRKEENKEEKPQAEEKEEDKKAKPKEENTPEKK